MASSVDSFMNSLRTCFSPSSPSFKNSAAPRLKTSSRWKTLIIIGILSAISALAYVILFQKRDDDFLSVSFTGTLVTNRANDPINTLATAVTSTAATALWQRQMCTSIPQAQFWEPTLKGPSAVDRKDVVGITNASLSERFIGMQEIGKGGYGSVYRVKDVSTKKNYALKIFDTFHSAFTHEVIRYSTSFLLDQGVTPHLTRCYETHRIVKNYNDDVSKAPKPGDKQMLLMEALDGDLEKNHTAFSFEQRVVFQLQNTHVVDKLRNLFHIQVEDNQQKNRFFVGLSSEHMFRGYRLTDFDFWKYRVMGVDGYIPKPKHLLKLGDYDPWNFHPYPFQRHQESTDNLVCPESLSEFASKVRWARETSLRSLSSPDDVLGLLKKWTQEPELSATVLEMD